MQSVLISNQQYEAGLTPKPTGHVSSRAHASLLRPNRKPSRRAMMKRLRLSSEATIDAAVSCAEPSISRCIHTNDREKVDIRMINLRTIWRPLIGRGTFSPLRSASLDEP